MSIVETDSASFELPQCSSTVSGVAKHAAL
jgi:hypothetical protein